MRLETVRPRFELAFYSCPRSSPHRRSDTRLSSFPLVVSIEEVEHGRNFKEADEGRFCMDDCEEAGSPPFQSAMAQERERERATLRALVDTQEPEPRQNE